jgi:hypothetical protein
MFDAAGNQWWFGDFTAPINADAAQTNGQHVTVLANGITLSFVTSVP